MGSVDLQRYGMKSHIKVVRQEDKRQCLFTCLCYKGILFTAEYPHVIVLILLSVCVQGDRRLESVLPIHVQ